MKTILSRNGGVTLIALVLTMILILIISGVTISTLTGDNGSINRAVSTRNKTQISDIIDKIKVDITNKQIEKQTISQGELSIDDLREILNRYFENIENADLNNTDMVLKCKKEYGEHEINLSDIIKGTVFDSN